VQDGSAGVGGTGGDGVICRNHADRVGLGVPLVKRMSAISAVHQAFAATPAGGEGGAEVRVFGHITGVRVQLGACFLDLDDSSATIQLMAGNRYTPDWNELRALDRGTNIVATGTVVRTLSGQLSIRLLGWNQM
jgi:lysyl-tRNA synthetase class II